VDKTFREKAMAASRHESSYMKMKIAKMGATLFAIGICICSIEVRAQTSTTMTTTTTKGAFSEYVPASQTLVVRTDVNPAPLRYTVTKQTTIVDETGAPVAIERISSGVPLAIDYTGTGDQLVASRIVVHGPVATTAPVTTTTTTAPVTEQHTVTTTETTRPLTHDEKEALKDQRKERKEALKEEIERRKDALEKAKDKLEDGDHH
jgi:hypothetical protein